LEIVPISGLVDVTNTRNVAVERVLVASTRSLRCPLSYSARVIETVSTPPAAGLMVKVAERDVSLSEAVITALAVACTCVVLILKLLFAEPGRDHRKIEDDTTAIQRILCYREKLNRAP